MAALDNSTTPFKVALTTIVVSDGGSNSLTLCLEQGSSITWSETGRTVAEAQVRGRHQTTPVLLETTDGNVTGSVTLLVSSWKGSSNVHPYEAMTLTGNAAAWATTAIGSGRTLKWLVTTNSTVDEGGSQAATFAYVHSDSIEVGEQEGLYSMTVSFTDFENRPTWA